MCTREAQEVAWASPRGLRSRHSTVVSRHLSTEMAWAGSANAVRRTDGVLDSWVLFLAGAAA